MKMTLLPSPLSRAGSEGFFPWGLLSPSPDFPGSVHINTSSYIPQNTHSLGGKALEALRQHSDSSITVYFPAV